MPVPESLILKIRNPVRKCSEFKKEKRERESLSGERNTQKSKDLLSRSGASAGMVVHDYSASTWEIEAEGLEVRGQPSNIPTQEHIFFFLL